MKKRPSSDMLERIVNLDVALGPLEGRLLSKIRTAYPLAFNHFMRLGRRNGETDWMNRRHQSTINHLVSVKVSCWFELCLFAS